MNGTKDTDVDCKRVSKQLIALADGALPAAEAETVRTHVSGCTACAGRLAEAERVARALRSLPRTAVPDDLWPRLARGIRREALERRRHRVRVRRLVAAFAPLAAAAGLAVGLFLPSPPVRPTPAPDLLASLVREHTQLANEPFVSGDDLLVAECAFPAEAGGTRNR